MSISQLQAPNISFIMAEDTMEISSEHGMNLGDEEIDIDIDFTTGQADEDYILEDVTPQVSFEEAYQPQPSPARGDYDPMVDDDDGSYSMADADLLHEEIELQMEDRTIGPPLLGQGLSHLGDDYLEQPALGLGLPAGGDDEVGWEHDGMTEKEPVNFDTTIPEHAAEAIGSYENNEATSHTRSDEAGTPTTADDEVRTLQKQSPANSHRGSPAHSGSESALISKESKDSHSDHTDASLVQESSHVDINKPTLPTFGDDVAPSTQSPEVIVMYQSMEYALFAKTDSDDPDSFFISDLSIAEKPLLDLFSAIRHVIHDDLSEEDELCLSVQDLGLEIEENSSMVQDFTFGQIITLYYLLQHNNAVNSPQPLCVLLGTRPNFAKRLAILTAGATDGKGLSELVSWDDESERLEEGAGLDEEARETHSTIREGAANSDAADVEGLEPISGDPGLNGGQISRSQEFVRRDCPHADDEPGRDTEGAPERVATSSPPQTTAAPQLEPHSSKQSPPSDGYDEDGDIIDYSDEEGEDTYKSEKALTPSAAKPVLDGHETNNGTDTTFLPSCLKPHICFCSKCNDILLAEYEAINEELHRRSISRANDDLTVEAEQQRPHYSKAEDSGLQGDYNADDGVDYDDDNNTKNLKHESVYIGREDLSAIDGETLGAGDYPQEEHTEIVGSTGNGIEHGGDHKLQNNDTEAETHNNDVVGFEHDDDDSPNTLAELGEDTSKQSEPMVADNFDYADDEHENVLEDNFQAEEPFAVQPVDHSRQLTENVSPNSGKVDETYEDEIGYEDDEDENPPRDEAMPPVAGALPNPNAGSAKRVRAEEGPDEAMITRSKDAKRPRS